MLAATAQEIKREDGTTQSLNEFGATACEIYSALSNRDSFDIFCLASSGIPAKTRILVEQDFSRKRYYSRLKLLIKAGLVKKMSGHYVHTDLGRRIYETQIISMREFLSHDDANHLILGLSQENTQRIFVP